MASFEVVIEVLLLAAVIYGFIRFLLETRGSGVLKGLIISLLTLAVTFIALVYVLKLRHLKYIAETGFTIFLTGLIILFQPELRQALVRLGATSFFKRASVGDEEIQVMEEIIQACKRLSRRRLGAIIVIEREIALPEIRGAATEVDAKVSSRLLHTIFFKDSPLHDGAVVIKDGRIAAAGCLLPLSDSPNIAQNLGTRHRAAVGVTAECDALAIVVSEETSRISVARDGRIEVGVKADRLREILSLPQKDPERSSAVLETSAP